MNEPTWDPWVEEFGRRDGDTGAQDREEGFYSRPEIADRLGLHRTSSKMLRIIDRLRAEDRLETREGTRVGSDGRVYPVMVYRIRPKIGRGEEEAESP